MDDPTSAPLAVVVVRALWFVLTAMMLVSRVLFTRRGTMWMRGFLDRWKTSRTRRRWGVTALLLAGLVVALCGRDAGVLAWQDLVVAGLLVVVLVADGAVNVLPSGFTTFKDRVQAVWVARRRDVDRARGRDLFAVGNVVLGAAALGWGSVVALYRPVPATLLLGAAAVAVVATPLLVTAAERET